MAAMAKGISGARKNGWQRLFAGYGKEGVEDAALYGLGKGKVSKLAADTERAR